MRHRTLFVVITALGLAVAACGDDDSGDDTSGAATTAAATATTTAAGAATTAAASATSAAATDPYGMGGTDGAAAGEGTVALADNDELQARILVDGEGRTLYLFERDNGTSTACAADPCRSNWPAFAPEGGPEAGDGVDADALDTVDGQVPGHVTYQGHLLYYFAGDRAPGDVNGLGIPAWFPLDADGDKVGG